MGCSQVAESVRGEEALDLCESPLIVWAADAVLLKLPSGRRMPPTILSKKASNWVDRGEAPHSTIERVLGRLLQQNPAHSRVWFREQAEIIVGMVAADATEVHLVGYLRTLFPYDEQQARDSSDFRTTAIALWHIAKAALVRDFAERVLRGDVPPNEPTPDRLGHWLATRILSPDELARFEREGIRTEKDD